MKCRKRKQQKSERKTSVENRNLNESKNCIRYCGSISNIEEISDREKKPDK